FFNLLLVALPVWLLLPRFVRDLADAASPRARVLRGLFIALVLLLEVAAAFGGRAALWIAVAGVALPGGAALALSRLRSPLFSPRVARLACLVLFVAGLLALLLRPAGASPWQA